MAKEEITPSEWQIMEVLWACGEPLTSSEVYKRMQGNVDMSMRMVRVLMNRLNQKNIHKGLLWSSFLLIPFLGKVKIG